MAILAGWFYRRPSEKMVVIGVTGTTGKSTTISMLARILNNAESRGSETVAADFHAEKAGKCGYITTVCFFDGEKEFINKHGLSMPGGWVLQKQLKLMLRNGCKYAVVECTSEGLTQNRHKGINFDVALFTNLSRAHLEAHGSFGNYQTAKGKLFLALQNRKKKAFFEKKMTGVNLDDPLSGYFLSFSADKKFGVSFKNLRASDLSQVFQAHLLRAGPPLEFDIDDQIFILNLLGEFNAKNAGLAAACAAVLGVDLALAASALKNFHDMPGRMENIPNSLGFKIIVDYGCEPASFQSAIEAAAQLPHSRLIHVFGSTGGHRDKAKRFEFGKISAQYADYIIITNDDVYESDPKEIAANIESGIMDYELRKPQYEIILDRRQAIHRAISIAQKGDIIIMTGKGSEQFLVLPGNKRIAWDDREAVRQELIKIK